MEKYLVTIEFRYSDEPKNENYGSSKSKTVTIGVYDTFDEACLNGNKQLDIIESKFPLHKFPNGSEAKRERFSKNGGCFGSKHDLVSNLAYIKTPFDFYAKITTLKYNSIDTEIENIISAVKRYKNYKSNL